MGSIYSSKLDKGAIVLVPFPFTDSSTQKVRPALVLAKMGRDVIAACITSNTTVRYPSEYLIVRNTTNGLKKDSVIKLHTLFTLEISELKRLIGTVSGHDLQIVNTKLIELLDL